MHLHIALWENHSNAGENYFGGNGNVFHKFIYPLPNYDEEKQEAIDKLELALGTMITTVSCVRSFSLHLKEYFCLTINSVLLIYCSGWQNYQPTCFTILWYAIKNFKKLSQEHIFFLSSCLWILLDAILSGNYPQVARFVSGLLINFENLNVNISGR